MYFQRVKRLLAEELSARNTARSINAFVMLVLRYDFGIVHWTDLDLGTLNIKTMVEFCNSSRKCHREVSHTRSQQEGRSIPSIRTSHFTEVQKLRNCFEEKGKINALRKAIERAATTY